MRENEEDLYAGIEYRLTPDVYQCLKLITRPGCEKIVRYAFEYARRNNRKKVTCFTKDNIMKMTDGLFHKVFDEIGAAVPGHREGALDRRHRRRQAGRHAGGLRRHRDAEPLRRHPLRRRGADRRLGRPGRLGQHRRAAARCSRPSTAPRPRRAGQNLANPSGLLLGAVMMLVHIDQPDVAERVHNAWLQTIEDGVHTYDIYRGRRQHARRSAPRNSPPPWSRASGQKPATLKPVSYASRAAADRRSRPPPPTAAGPEAAGRRRGRVHRLAQPGHRRARGKAPAARRAPRSSSRC